MPKSNLEQASSMFGFLKDLLRLRNKPIKLIASYQNAQGHWVHHLDETPATKNGIAFWGSLGIRAMDALSGDIGSAIQLGITTFKETKGSILRIPKVTTPDPPEPSELLGPWIENDISDVWENPILSEYVEFVGENEDVPVTLSLSAHPEVLNEFEKWLIEWRSWAEKVQKDAEVQKLYTSLFEARDVIKDQAQEWEFVLGIGRLRLGAGSDKEIDRHLFTIPCVIDLDATTGVLFVRIDEEFSFKVEDDWIQGFKKPELSDLEEVTNALNESEDLTDESIKKEFVKLAHKYRADLVTDIDPGDFKKRDSLVLAPSLILRRRGKQDLIRLLEKLESAFASTSELPPPLQALLEPGFGEKTSVGEWSGDGAVVVKDENAYLPLSLNAKQIQALESADTRNATIIQGPPGTGKTRTIAVMVSHFLAKGQRVLVAAQTAQALKEVRTQLPDEIKDLAVANLGSTKADNDDLQKAVNALVEKYEDRHALTTNFEEYQLEIIEKIDKLHRERAEAIREIVDLRSQEAEALEVEGIKGSRAHLAWVYLDRRNEYSWLSEISDDDSPGIEFSNEDLEKLIENLRLIWSAPETPSLDSRLPAVDELWTQDQFEKGLRLRSQVGKVSTDLPLVADFAREFASILESALHVFQSLSMVNISWVKEFTSQLLELGDKPILAKIENGRTILSDALEQQEIFGSLHEIECGDTNLEWLPILSAVKERIARKGDLRTSVTGQVKSSLISGTVMRNATPILNSVKILGKSPNTLIDLDRIRALVQFDHALKVYIAELGIEIVEQPKNRIEAIAWIKSQAELVASATALNETTTKAREYLQRKLPRSSKLLTQKMDLESLYDSATAITADADLNLWKRNLSVHIARLQTHNAKGEALEAISDYVNATSGDDPEIFAQSRSRLANLLSGHAFARSVLDNVAKHAGKDKKFLDSVAAWMESGREPNNQPGIVQCVRQLVDAFSWKRLRDAVGQGSSSDYAALFREVTRCDQQIEILIRQLAMRRSWKKALERIDAETLSQMQRYALESRKFGAGTGITASRRLPQIRKLLEACRPAIPAWIMSIDDVVKRFPPELEMFDVVIVDEASQARLDSIFLLALSKRVVIVGDHKQVSPERGMIPDVEVQGLIRRHLAGDKREANWGNADLSLFDECKVAFVNMITLTEHRRCVPEIIQFSNQIAYLPERIRLIPVRQTGSDALDPVRTVFVKNGYVRLNGGQPENPPEAEAIVEEVLRMLKDPSYRNMSIGVITLQGTKQQDLIREKLIHAVDPKEWEQRQIRVGTPPDFQGSERDVILLSMVMAPNGRFAAQTKENMVQRYNVAASRAKDQMVLVHSLRSSDLKNPNDLRKQLIDYCLNVEQGRSQDVQGSIGIVPEGERVAPFDSLFEQRVHNRIVSRGYKVIPQYEPQIEGYGYRIDLVVVGPYGKFAVECDGEFWHGADEFAKDIIRQENLERAGWRFFRVRESSFYSDPSCLDELWPQLEKFVAEKSVPSNDNSLSGHQEEASAGEVAIREVGKSSQLDFDTTEDQDFAVEQVDASDSELSFGTPQEIFVDGLRVREFPKPLAAEYSWMQPYRSWDPEASRRLSKIDFAGNEILDELLEIVRVEGPILGSYLMRRHYKASGGSSLSSSKESLYLKKIRSVMNRGELIAEDQANGDTLASATFRLHDQNPRSVRVRGARDLYDMPPREIAMVIRGVIKSHTGLGNKGNRELLFRQVLLLLDFTKLTKKAEEHLTKIFSAYTNEILDKK